MVTEAYEARRKREERGLGCRHVRAGHKTTRVLVVDGS